MIEQILFYDRYFWYEFISILSSHIIFLKRGHVFRWQESRNDGPGVHINHPVTNFEFLYEPFYVAKDTVPPHDERFVGYGYTRNTQV